MRKSIVVQMKKEMEARPVAELVQTANRFESQIYLEVDEKRVNVKSIMGMMGLALINGTEAILDAEGKDEAEAITALEKFLSE